MAIRLLPEPSLPVELSTFVGRRRELGHLRTLLATDRLVTVTGTGGVGKTRLAMELAQGAAFDFPAGVWVVELARIGSGDLVGTAIAEATSAARESQTSALERVARRLSEGRQLLILDNCEHVVGGAAEASWHLLTHCSGLTILATSREALDVRGERVVPLLPLQQSESTDAHGRPGTVSEAMQLFGDRAQLLDGNGELRPDTAADVADICRRLDGLPLALELAAAWVPVLSLKQVRDRLDGSLLLLGRSEKGRPTRHRSIHAALDWSERLLTPPQATAFARLSVFVGGFSLEGAEAVLGGGDEDGGSPLALTAALVTRSLLIADTSADEARYRLLEPVRQYAAEHLRADPDEAEAATRRRHLSYFAELAEAAEEPIIGGPDQPWMRRLDSELGNIRAALAWGFDNDHQTASRLAAALLVYCRHRGLYSEGASWALEAARSTGLLRGRALCMAGWLSSEMGDAGRGRVLSDESYRITAESGGLPDLTMVLVARALAEYVVGDLEALRATAEEAVAVARGSGSQARLMWALWAPAVCAAANDDHQQALDLFREARAIAVDLGNVSWGSVLAVNVVDSAIDNGDMAAASALLRRELHAETAADPSCGGYMIEDAAILAIQQGDHPGGIRLLGASCAYLTRAGYRETPDEAKRRRQWIDTARQHVDPQAADALWGEGEALTLAEALDAARTVVAEPTGAVTTGAVGGNSFIREGEFWSLAYAGTVTRVKDSKGVRDVATLIAASGQGVAAVDLVSSGRERSEAPSERGLRTEGHVGEVLDAQARAQYRARLLELDEAIADADRCNDPHRASRARDERTFLLAELGAAVGLAGRPRLALDPAERGRKAVAWRVRDAINHIEAAHPALGRHLRHAVRTGSFCVYDPDQPTEWRL
jgi:non-specific serine/threonine protein kinase